MAVPRASLTALVALALLSHHGPAAEAFEAPQRLETFDAQMIQTDVSDVLDVFSKAAKFVIWTKHTRKHCYWQRMWGEAFSSLADAQAKCSSLSTCFGVYDQGCDETANDVFLCENSQLTNSSQLDPSMSSCVYELVNASVNSLSLPSPTPGPSPGPSAGPSPMPRLSATGDPHLVNMYGERFDIFQEGKHVLLRIPKGVAKTKAYLHVAADAQHAGPACSDLYFKTLNVTGEWAEAVHRGGLQYFAGAPRDGGRGGWARFRSVDLKVRWGHTGDGIEYLNVFIRHLSETGYNVGGLLGEDDHSRAALRSELCARTVSLLQIEQRDMSTDRSVAQVSVAQADLM